MPTLALLDAFVAGAQWAIDAVRVVNDGDDHFYRMDPDQRDIFLAAKRWVNREVDNGAK